MRIRWTIKKLGDICRFQGGSQPPKSQFVANPCNNYVRLLQIRDFKNDDRAVYVPITNKNKTCTTEDILIARYGASVGQIHRGKAGAYNVALIKTILDIELTDRNFFYYYLTSNLFQEPLMSVADRSAQAGFSKKDISSFQFPLPPLPEQKQIVAILDKAFAGIDRAIENTKKNLANAHELFDSHLNSVFLQKGEEYVEMTLREVSLDFGRGKSKHRPRNAPELYGGPYPFIQTGDVRNSLHTITNYKQTYSDIGLAQSKLWPKGTICITIAANIAETGILEFEACFPDSVIGIVVNEQISINSYVEYLLQFKKSLIKAKGKGSAQDNINLGTFEKERFPFPSLKTQKQIVTSLNELSLKTQELELIYNQKLNALAELKQSILQKAFSGELTNNSKILEEVGV